MATQEKEQAKFTKMLKDFAASLKDVFTIQNLTLSLFSAILTIGVGFGSSEVSKLMQNKFYSNPTMYLIFTMIVLLSYVIAILGPALLYGIKTKSWSSVVYIVILEILWFSVFVSVLFFTTPEEALPPLQLGQY